MTAYIDIDRFLALEARLDECERHIAWLRAADRHADPASYPPPGVILNPHGPTGVGNGAGCRMTAAPGSDAAADIEVLQAEIAALKAKLKGMTETAAAHAAASTETQTECDQLRAELTREKLDAAASRACNVGTSAKWKQMESDLTRVTAERDEWKANQAAIRQEDAKGKALARVMELENALYAMHKRFSEELGNGYKKCRSDLAAADECAKQANDEHSRTRARLVDERDAARAELAEAKALLGAYPHDGWTQKVRDYLHPSGPTRGPEAKPQCTCQHYGFPWYEIYAGCPVHDPPNTKLTRPADDVAKPGPGVTGSGLATC